VNCNCLACHFEGSHGNLPRLLLAAQFYFVVQDREFPAGAQLFDLVPAQGNVPQRIAVEGDLARHFAHQFAVQRVSVAEHQHIGLRVCGGFGRRIVLRVAADARAQGYCEG
jgi:hypothetical protein